MFSAREALYDYRMLSIVRPRVVMADDHPLVLQTAAAILGRAANVVAAVSSGFAAIEAVARLEPDVVVLDIAMPGIDGFETALRLRASGASARIVFLSNHVEDEFVVKALSLGASAFVRKARMQSDLIPAIDHALAGRTFLPSASVLGRSQHAHDKSHHLQLYSSDAVLIASVTAYFETALASGDSIITLASEAHLRAFTAGMEQRGHDVTA